MASFINRISRKLSNYRKVFLEASARTYAHDYPGKFNTMLEQIHLRRLMNYLEVDCIFDVGANSGQYASMLRDKVEFSGSIVSFEPIPELAELLRKKAHLDPTWSIQEMALSDCSGRKIFNVMQSDRFSSLGTPTAKDTEFLMNLNTTVRTIEVQVETLDSVFPQIKKALGFKKPFLKMDTQGFDLHVIRGGMNCIKEFVGIQSELAIKRLYVESVPFQEVISCYRELGFDLSAFVPNNEGHFPWLIETDGIFVNRGSLT